MPKTYVDVGPMAYSRNSTKVDAKYGAKATHWMRDTAVRQVRRDDKFTPEKTAGSQKGYYFDATLAEVKVVTSGQVGVSCKIDGVLATYPDRKLVAAGLSASARITGGATDRDVQDCVEAVIEAMVKDKVIPTLKKL